MMRPFKAGDKLSDHAVPMAELLAQLQAQMAEFKALRDQVDVSDSGSERPSTVRSPPSSLTDEGPLSSVYGENEAMRRLSDNLEGSLSFGEEEGSLADEEDEGGES